MSKKNMKGKGPIVNLPGDKKTEPADTVSLKEAKKLESKIVDSYKDFLEDESRFDELESYEFRGNNLVIEVFSFQEEMDRRLKLVGMPSGEENYKPTFYFAVGKVLGGSEKALEDYPVGTIISLKDRDFATFTNPKYDLWNKGGFGNSNGKPVGSEVPKYASNIANIQNSYIFVTDKIKSRSTGRDYRTFLLDPTSITAIIKEPLNLIRSES